ncbi:MAG: HTH domain-containing protein [Fusobacteria bacterium]|nr:MAG: HTH domain-containing protein [Fusobacteriota bacterium]KAF0230253.1 MAG: HTH domain-containing [Fusobacteriota bacterium]
MFNKNLKYFRLKNNLNMSQLAKMSGLSKMAISYYEKGERTPDMNTLKKLAEVLNVNVMDFMLVRDDKLLFQHGAFRKNSRLNKSRQEYMREEIEEYFNRFYNIVNILGEKVLPDAPRTGVLVLSDDNEDNARALRSLLRLSLVGPIGNLVNIVENNGILVYQHVVEGGSYSGMNGSIDDRPYIAVNVGMSSERQRFTIAHELAHIYFNWSGVDESLCESLCNLIAGSFLFPDDDAVRELGLKRKALSGDLKITAVEFGISIQCLAYRARELKIISEAAYREFNILVSKLGWRKGEPSRIGMELSNLFRQLVFRAIAEGEISIQKGAELLRVSFSDVESGLLCGGI